MRWRAARGGPLLVGIDLGTSSCKLAAFDLQGRLLRLVRRALITQTPEPGASEQAPEDWWAAVTHGLRQLLNDPLLTGRPVIGVGICGNWPSLVLIDRRGQPLCPAILWKDLRGQLPANITAEALAERVGLPASLMHTLPVGRLAWLRSHRPTLLRPDRLAWLLGAKDTLVFWLTGQAVTDPIEAWWSGLAGHYGSAWDEELLSQLGIERSCLPQISRWGSLAGRVSAAAAQATGLPIGTPVAVGSGDGVCGALGAGLARPGQAMVISGWSVIVATPAADSLAFWGDEAIVRFPFLGPNQCLLYTSTPSGSGFAWFSRLLGERKAGQVRRQAVSLPAASGRPCFIPHLEGVTSPWVDLSLRGAWLDLEPVHGWPELYRAVIEGTVFSVRHILDALQRRGATLESLRLAGGGMRERAMYQLYADGLQRPVARLAVNEAGCLGAAICAALAAGVYPDLPEALRRMVSVKGTIVPGKDSQLYAPRYERFCEACQRLSA